MPPSPAMRCSTGRELRVDSHKRGRSLENGIRLKQRDDDLALFNEVQSREKDNFLLQGNDDFEDIFANKLRNFSDYKLGINIPARGESSDLLHTEETKNDYEWLITPPDTPLFASLDDEVPQVNVAQRGRLRTQPISISRSSTMEKSHRSSKGSASPNRISLSPRSHNNTFEGRYRATSAPGASPPSLKPTATSLKSSSPPSRKPSTPPRSSPISNSTTTSRGISGFSPKVKAWQSTIPGFSTEVPPNLRTSLADRPASYIRGSSPASRSSRQSMSPTASRSISSSKGSVGSSADDELESFSSVAGNNKQRLNSRRVSGFQNNNRGLVSKKQSRTVSSCSAPKRSFDLALRQMDHKKGPQNMFRPLLSSVPSSTFHAGISTSSSPHRTINSSITTSSNASSGHGNTGVHDPETSQDDAISEVLKIQDDDVIDDEVFVIEKDEAFDDSRNTTDHDPSTLTASLTFDDISEINSQTETGLLICSKCGCSYSVTELENENNVCGDCLELSSPLTIIDPVETTTVVEVKVQSGKHDDLVKDGQSTYKEPIWNFLSETSLSRSQSEECETKKVNHETFEFSKSNVESLEGAGISILLKKSSSLKGAVLRNTSFSASSMSYDDFSYVRGSTNSMRSRSATSSVDFGVNKQTDTHFHRQLSSTKSEIENYKYDVNDFHLSCSSGREGQENNEENDTFTSENQVHVDPDESLLNNCLKDEEFQKVEDSEPHDFVEYPLDAILEGEFDQKSGQFSTDLKCEVELSSTSSIEELPKDVAVSVEDHDTSNHISNVIEESIVLVEQEGGLKGRSLTLEEATDTILFCSSLIHNLAHSAATIAVEKENSNSFHNNTSWPLIPATRKSDLNKPEFQIPNTTKPSSKSQKSTQKKVEIDTLKAPNFETEGQIDQPKTRIVGVRDLNNGESKKPPMLESKCNCTIM